MPVVCQVRGAFTPLLPHRCTTAQGPCLCHLFQPTYAVPLCVLFLNAPADVVANLILTAIDVQSAPIVVHGQGVP